MALMLQQMAEALVKTANLIEEADREAAGLFDLRPAEGVQPTTRIVASTPPPLGYTTPLPGSSTIPSPPLAIGQPLPVNNNRLPIGTSGNWAMDLNTGELVWTGSASTTPQEAWQIQVLSDLWNAGPTCKNAAVYIIENDVEFDFTAQNTYASWTFDGHINLRTPDYSLDTNSADEPFMLSLIVHEARHLEQGPRLALSVLGELDAWQIQYDALVELNENPVDYISNWHLIRRLPSLSAGPISDEDLIEARALMLDSQGWGYLIWLLPLRP